MIKHGAAFVLLILWSAIVCAHEVPDRVQVNVYINAQPERLTILVRLPANALIDFLLPTLPDSNWLDLRNTGTVTEEASKVWIADRFALYADGVALPKPQLVAVRLSRNNDPAFNSYETALEHIRAESLPAETLVLQDQVTVDALLELPISSRADLTYRPQFGRLGVLVFTSLAFLPENGEIRRFEYEGDPLTFPLNPTITTTVSAFFNSGLGFAAGNREMLLALLCIGLALLHAQRRSIKTFVVAMTAAETIAAFAFLLLAPWPTSWIVPVSELLSAGLVVYLGIEAIITNQTLSIQDISKNHARIGVAAIAGAILGVAFAASLHRQLQFGGAHPALASISFVAGAVLCQTLLLAVAILVCKRILRLALAPTAAVVIVAALAIHVSWWTMLDRTKSLSLYTTLDQLQGLKGWGAIGLATLIVSALILKRRPLSKTGEIEPIA